MDNRQKLGRMAVREQSGTRQYRPAHPAVPGILAQLWAGEAAEGLFRRCPRYSAQSGLTYGQIGLAAAIAGVTTAGLVLAPDLTLSGTAMLGAAYFIAVILLRIAACATPRRQAPHRDLPEGALPRASILVALYREARVLPSLVQALQRIDYPADRLEIKLAIEADDLETLTAASICALDPRFEIIPVPPGSPRTKPRALNYALRFCTGEFLTIHDAEDRPHPGQLRRAVESFAAAGQDLACLQAPLNWYNRADCWLTRQFALEYAAHFEVMLPFYTRLKWPLPLGGTSNYFRTAILREVGGWDAHNVTEDADLGFRLAAEGYRSDVILPPTLEEAPIRLEAWICQRTRWLKGYMQTLAVHSRSLPRRRNWRMLPALMLTLGAATLSALLHAPFTLLTLVNPLVGISPAMVTGGALLFLACGYASAALSAAVGMRRASLPCRLFDLLTMPIYWPLQSLAALRAIWQLLRNPYFWDKTEHGHSLIPSTPRQDACTSPSHRRLLRFPSASESSSSRDGGAVSPSVRKKVRE